MNKFLLALLLTFASFALAGDEPVTQVAYTGTQGCTAILRPKVRYAVQCTTACYVRVTANTTSQPATAAGSVYVDANKLYDVYTTSTKRYICAIQSASGGNLKVFLYEDNATP